MGYWAGTGVQTCALPIYRVAGRHGSALLLRPRQWRRARIRKPEESERVAIAEVEEEVLTHAARQLDRLDQRHSEDALIEIDRARSGERRGGEEERSRRAA